MPNEERLERIRPHQNERDRRGNLLRDYGQIYVYDAANRVVEVHDDQGNIRAAYGYYAGTALIGLRVLIANGAITRVERLVCDEGKLIEVYDVTNAQEKWTDTSTLLERYVYTVGRNSAILVQATIGGQTYNVTTSEFDRGKVGALVDGQGRTAQSYRYGHDNHFTVVDAQWRSIPQQRWGRDLLCRVVFNNQLYDPVTDLLQCSGYWLSLRHGNRFPVGTLPNAAEDVAGSAHIPRPRYMTELEATRRSVVQRNLANTNPPPTTVGQRVGRVATGTVVVVLNVGAWCLGPEIGVPVTAFTLGMGGATAYYNRRADLEAIAQRDVDLSFLEAAGFVGSDTLGVSAVYMVVAGEDIFFATPVSGADRAEAGVMLVIGAIACRYTPSVGNQVASHVAQLRRAQVESGVVPSAGMRTMGYLSDRWLLTSARRQGVNGQIESLVRPDGIAARASRLRSVRDSLADTSELSPAPAVGGAPQTTALARILTSADYAEMGLPIPPIPGRSLFGAGMPPQELISEAFLMVERMDRLLPPARTGTTAGVYPSIAQKQTVQAALLTREGYWVLGSGGSNLRPGQVYMLDRGQIAAMLAGYDAEPTVVVTAQGLGLRPYLLVIAGGRGAAPRRGAVGDMLNFCEVCDPWLIERGAQILEAPGLGGRGIRRVAVWPDDGTGAPTPGH